MTSSARQLRIVRSVVRDARAILRGLRALETDTIYRSHAADISHLRPMVERTQAIRRETMKRIRELA